MATKNALSALSGFDAKSQIIKNAADPVSAQDAATKNFSSNASNLTAGTLPVARLPAFTGDATVAVGTNTITFSNSGVAAGTYNAGATQSQSFTVDTKGRVTGVGAATTITPAWSSVTGKPTTVAGYGITDAVTLTGIQTVSNKTIVKPVFQGVYVEGAIATTVSTSTYTMSLDNASLYVLTLATPAVALTFPAPVLGAGLTLILKQDATGSRVVTWPSGVKWPGNTAPFLSAAANLTDKFVFTCDGTNWLASNGGQAY